MDWAAVLCWYRRARLNDRQYFGIDFNVKVSAISERLITRVNLRTHKLPERAAKHGVTDIQDPLVKQSNRIKIGNLDKTHFKTYLSRQHGDVSLFRKIAVCFLESESEL